MGFWYHSCTGRSLRRAEDVLRSRSSSTECWLRSIRQMVFVGLMSFRSRRKSVLDRLQRPSEHLRFLYGGFGRSIKGNGFGKISSRMHVCLK